MLSIENIFDTLEEIPHFGNSTIMEKTRAIVENISTENVLSWAIILAIVGIMFSLLLCAIVHKVKSHKRRENRWKKASFQERKCSSCRSLSCEHRSFTNLRR